MSRSRLRRWYSIPVAAVAAATTFVVSGIVRGTYPFGDRSRNTNVLGQQFIPMQAHLRDLLTGNASGDLLFNWSSGFGVPFLGDFVAYVGASLSWLVLLFPRDRIDLALFVIATVAMAVGATAMTAYLRFLRPGPGWLAASRSGLVRLVRLGGRRCGVHDRVAQRDDRVPGDLPAVRM